MPASKIPPAPPATDTPATPPATAKTAPRSRLSAWWLLIPAVLAGSWLGGGDERPSVTDGADDPIVETASVEDRLDPIGLPPPSGTQPRSRPLQTVWALGTEVAEGDPVAAAVSEEAERAVAYLVRWSMAGDGLGISSPITRRLEAAEDELLARARAPTTWRGPVDGLVDKVDTSLASYPDDDTSLVVVTGDPASWEGFYEPTTVATTERDGPTAQRYLIRLRPGQGTDAAVHGEAPMPAEVTVDTDERGDLAAALARSFVESYGGRWTAP